MQENKLKRLPRIFSIDLSKLEFAEGEAPTEIQVLPCGKWNHPYYGPIIIDEAVVTQMKQNFDAGLRRDIPITEGHEVDDEKPAIAWFKELVDKGLEGLFATVEWTKQGKTLLAEKAYKYFSPEFYSEYEDPETRGIFENVLVGGALTNKPYFKSLRAVTLSELSIKNPNYQFNDMLDLNEILAKKPEDLNDEEKALLVEKREELTTEQKETFKTVLPEETTEETPEQKAEREEKERGDANEANGLNRDGSPKVEASEKGKKGRFMSEAEIRALEDKADQGAKAFAELQDKKIAERVSKMTFSEANKDGRLLPKQNDSVVSFMKSLSEVQRDQFVNIVNNMPKAAMFGEVGDKGLAAGSAAQEFQNAITAEIAASGGKMKYSEALKSVKTKKPELVKAYNDELAAKASE